MLQMFRLVKVRDTKRVFFTDEKNFYLKPPIRNQNTRAWSIGKKADVRPDRLIVEREKFAPHVMVSAGVCFGGKGRLHFVGEKAKVNAKYNVGRPLPELIADCKRLLPAGFIFQQDGAPAHTAFLVQDWLNLSFIEKDQFSRFEPSGLSRVGCFAGEMS